MGYHVILRAPRTILREELEEFYLSIPPYKRCPTYISEDGDIHIAGAWSISGLRVSSYYQRVIRWFGKVKNTKLSYDHWVSDAR